jgi:hypothetical protein
VVGKFETRKDTAQVLAESAAGHVGRIANILSGAVRDITHEVGEWATDLFEMREAAARARADELDESEDFGDDDYASAPYTAGEYADDEGHPAQP